MAQGTVANHKSRLGPAADQYAQAAASLSFLETGCSALGRCETELHFQMSLNHREHAPRPLRCHRAEQDELHTAIRANVLPYLQ